MDCAIKYFIVPSMPVVVRSKMPSHAGALEAGDPAKAAAIAGKTTVFHWQIWYPLLAVPDEVVKLDTQLLPAASVTLTPKVNEPEDVGVPLSKPFDARVSPVGNVPDDCAKVYGGVPPAAVKVKVNAVPVENPGSGPLVNPMTEIV